MKKIKKDKKNQKQKLYKVAEAARLLRFAPITLYRWIKTGKMKAIKVGSRSYRISERDLSVYLNQ